ncbi:MAG TPA: CpsB/CapC family capsule biosynthesis tyrosine phosphatase [Tepidisphaeraceae bacterium]|jgi:protein-tyrosine phosphatase|nr:CpsB/CapC family capsule biosynthesis tyrosine phosphatase [Tepidisphaeraceae bacterium]
MSEKIGRIDVHNHLLPGIDDGCKTVEESLTCARRLVEAGYTHVFCTPHIWPSLPGNTVSAIAAATRALQSAIDVAGIGLTLMPGGENNLRAQTPAIPPGELVTYGLSGKYILFDFWADRLPAFFEAGIAHYQAHGLTPILAHPERLLLVQRDPEIVESFAEKGLLLQGNLQCFSDPAGADTRRCAERFLAEGRYFMLGTDLHGPATLDCRLDGLARVARLVDAATLTRLTRDNPLRLVLGQ